MFDKKVYDILFTEKFEKIIERVLSNVQIKQFYNKMEFLENKGNKIGKPLGPYYFRELKFQEKRVYYLVLENKHIILFVGASNKKVQKKEIKLIRKNISYYVNNY